MIRIETLSEFEKQAGAAAGLLKRLANEHRLRVLCHLADTGEASVTALAEAVGLSNSALSQHLAKLREDGLVSFRRESQTLYYRLGDARAGRVLNLLKDMFCPPSPRKPETIQ